MVKTCFGCKKTKSVNEFYKSNTRYYQRECKLCNVGLGNFKDSISRLANAINYLIKVGVSDKH